MANASAQFKDGLPGWGSRRKTASGKVAFGGDGEGGLLY